EKIGNEVDRTNFSQPAYPFVNEGQRGANEVDEVDEGTSAETPARTCPSRAGAGCDWCGGADTGIVEVEV
ncbi:MAG: hypothetical protein ACREXX_08930, partial [Gammaproteobacteria bacterium]